MITMIQQNDFCILAKLVLIPFNQLCLTIRYLLHEGELSALAKQNHNLREVEGHSRSAIQDCGCDREGRKTKLGS